MSNASLDRACDALKKDLIHPDGPQISTMRNYRFAIWLYSPQDEFRSARKYRRSSPTSPPMVGWC